MAVGFIDNYIRRAPYHDPSTLMVLVILADCASPAGTMYYRVERLAKRARLGPRQFQRIMAQLEGDGVIQRIARADEKTGKQITNLYRLRKFPDTMPLVDVEEEAEVAYVPVRGAGEGVTHDTGGGVTYDTHRGVTHDTGGVSPMTPNPLHVSVATNRCNSLAAAQREGAPAKLSKADPEREALTAALGKYPQHFGVPRSANEWKGWNQALTSMMSGGFRAGDVPRAVNAWKRKFPGAQLTIYALDKHLGELAPAPPLAATQTRPANVTSYTSSTTIPPSSSSSAVTAEELEGLTEDEQRLYLATFDPATRARCQDGRPDQQQPSSEERHRIASERARAALARSSERAAAVVPHRRGLPVAGGRPLQVQ